MTIDSNVFAMMQTDTPYATYRKTILGKLYVEVLNPFTNAPEGILLTGDGNSDTAKVDTWSAMGDVFFARRNKKYFDTGKLITASRLEQKPAVKTIEQFSDDELKEVINQKFATLSKTVIDITSEAVLYRMLSLAKEMEKSSRIINTFEARLSDLQKNTTVLPTRTEL
jgi:neutral trehalase